ncbi:unnamed protein product [Orchesella dallaii]|uniref:Odorant receptor n=1 Tax=Orchesella dallaii TaxID=48710 RepID=A0ABP1RJ12_9HEXA
MLIQGNIMSFIRKFVREQEFYGTAPFTTDPTNLQLTLTTGKGRLRMIFEKWKIGMCYLHFIVLWMQLVHEVNEGLAPLVVSLKSFLYAFAMTVAAVSKNGVHKRSADCVELFNLFLQFERKHIKESTKTKLMRPETRQTMFFLLCGMISTPLIIPTYVLQLWFLPCNSATFGYFLFPECANAHNLNTKPNWAASSLFGLFLSCFMTLWLTLDSLGMYFFNALGTSLPQCFCLQTYTKLFEREIRNNSSKGLRTYRELQLLNCFYNCIQQDVLIVAMLLLSGAAYSIGNYALLALGRNISLPELLMFLVISLDCVLANFVYFGIMANVYTYSNEALGKVRETVVLSATPGKMRKWSRRCLLTMKPIKVSVGSVNYIDQLTPIIFFDFCVGQTINLLLME